MSFFVCPCFCRRSRFFRPLCLFTFTLDCSQIIAGDNYATDMAITTDQLCAFRTSAAVIQGYTTETVILNETTYITPTDITVKLQNRGATFEREISVSPCFSPHACEPVLRVRGAGSIGEAKFMCSSIPVSLTFSIICGKCCLCALGSSGT